MSMLGGTPPVLRDPNRDLAPFVEGMLMGMLDHGRLGNMPPGWSVEAMVPDPAGAYATYFVSPSGLRWRIRAELEESAPTGAAARPTEGGGS